MSAEIDWGGYDDEVGEPWRTDCTCCGEWMKLSHAGVLACPICDMADERYDPLLEAPKTWPSIYGTWVDEDLMWQYVDPADWLDDDPTEDAA